MKAKDLLKFLLKDFNTFMCDHTLHRGTKYFCLRYCLQAFRTEKNINTSY